MKIKLFSAAFLITLFLFSGNVNAQEENKDSLDVITNLSLFSTYAKQKSYEDAVKPWRFCCQNSDNLQKYYSQGHLAIYVNGAKMIKFFIKKNKKNIVAKNAYIDTLMLLYDKRIKYFGNSKKKGKGYVLGRKGIDLLRYRKEAVEEGYGYLKESVQLQGKYVEYATAVTFMQAARQMLKLEKITVAEMAENFMLTIEQLEKALIFQTKKKEKIKTAITNSETIFSESPAATCENLISIFTPRYNADKENLDLLKKITKFLTKKDCTDSDLFADVAVSWYPLEPSSESAAALAQVFAKRDDLEKAGEYYQKAVDLEQDSELKAGYLYKLALISKVNNKFSASRSFAREAIKLRSDWGDPYILIATLYAASANSCGVNSDPAIKDVERRAAYWVAVDKLVKARSVDPSVADDVRPLISSYSKSFPNSEKAFMAGFKAGQKHRVGSWIQETTTVRF